MCSHFVPLWQSGTYLGCVLSSNSPTTYPISSSHSAYSFSQSVQMNCQSMLSSYGLLQTLHVCWNLFSLILHSSCSVVNVQWVALCPLETIFSCQWVNVKDVDWPRLGSRKRLALRLASSWPVFLIFRLTVAIW